MDTPLRTGLSGPDYRKLPIDEYIVRCEEARGLMDAHGVGTLILFGSSREAAVFSYFSGMTPWISWSALILPRYGDLALISLVGPREKPMIQQQSWVSDVHAVGANAEAGLKGIIETARCMTEGNVAIGLAGVDATFDSHMEGLLYEACADLTVRGLDMQVTELTRRKRPRELAALRRTFEIANEAVAEASQSFQRHHDVERAAQRADFVARMLGAHDVRVLANFQAGTLAPLGTRASHISERLNICCATEHLGYWGMAAATIDQWGRQYKPAAVAAMLERLSGDVYAADLARAALHVVPQSERQQLLSYGLGGGVGLSLDQAPRIVPDSVDQARIDDVLCLRAIHGDGRGLACGISVVRVLPDGWAPL